MERPDLILLDESFISLDEAAVERTVQIIREERERGALIILSCHDYDLLTGCSDEIYKMVAGRLAHRLVRDETGQFKEAAL